MSYGMERPALSAAKGTWYMNVSHRVSRRSAALTARSASASITINAEARLKAEVAFATVAEGRSAALTKIQFKDLWLTNIWITVSSSSTASSGDVISVS